MTGSIPVLAVSILILLEVVLEEEQKRIPVSANKSFNPYFAGSSSGRKPTSPVNRSGHSFNPYFAGSSSGSLFR